MDNLSIPAFLDRTPLVFTYTNLNTYDICPYQFYRRYVVKDISYQETETMKFGNQVHSAFEQRLAGGKPLPENMRDWEVHAAPFANLKPKVEWKLAVKRDGKPSDYWNGAFVRGKVDCAILQSPVAFMADWKTGKVREDPFELEVGALLLKANAPYITRIYGSYVWLKENRIGERHDLSDVEATTKKVAARIRAIEADLAGNSFEKKQGPLCRFCDVLECEFNRKEK